MKGFTRTELRFSLCGLNCALCSMHLGGYCPGCGGGAGNQSCAIARCSLEHGGVAFCGERPEYPCARYEGFDDADSFIPHRSRARDVEQFRALGADAYLAQLSEKREILGLLLTECNDGRRKTLFTSAACLLPLEDLRAAAEELSAMPDAPVKEKALTAARLLQDAADRRGVSLKLKKGSPGTTR